ncbi:glutaredoxin family protein [Medicago truncatula]|uniref:Glutaredoxin family protein n=1 Tax=Medicago truncatula TaxID=3880 RepID=G7L1K0_MEDTR|nr:glutaredoxin family protein [Medicago truncatula]
MYLGFKEEFKELLGEGYYSKGELQKVFIEKKYIGGVEKLHDDKKLEKLFDCCERSDDIEVGEGGREACGDIKFVPC